jgi:hypothetical protein
MTYYYLIPLFGLVALACGGSGKHDAGSMSASGSGTADEGGAGSIAGSSSAGASSGGSAATDGSHAGAAGTGGNGGGAPSGGVGGSASGGVGAGGAAATLGCAKWTVDQATMHPVTATTGAGGLVLAYPPGVLSFGASHGDFSLIQEGLRGDFDIIVNWKDFVPGDAKYFQGPKLEAGLYWHDPGGAVYSAVGNVGSGTMQAAIVHGEQFTINSLSPVEPLTWYEGAAGSFRLQRAGTTVTVTTEVNDKSVTAASTEPFSEEPLQLALWFDADTIDVPAIKPSGVTITGVTVTGGGGTVKPDDFSCQ